MPQKRWEVRTNIVSLQRVIPGRENAISVLVHAKLWRSPPGTNAGWTSDFNELYDASAFPKDHKQLPGMAVRTMKVEWVQKGEREA